MRTSKRRLLRLMGAHDLLAPLRVGSPRNPRSHDGTIIPQTVDTLWGTDLTTTITGERLAAVFVALDHCSAECVGVHAALGPIGSHRGAAASRRHAIVLPADIPFALSPASASHLARGMSGASAGNEAGGRPRTTAALDTAPGGRAGRLARKVVETSVREGERPKLRRRAGSNGSARASDTALLC